MNEKHIEAAASQMGVDYGEALARMTVGDVLRIVDANTTRQEVEQALRANLAKDEALPPWQDVLGEAEQLVRQKFLWTKFIKGTPLENDVPVWIADFAQRAVRRERARSSGSAAIGAVRAGGHLTGLVGEIEREFVALEDLPAFIRRLQDQLREARASGEQPVAWRDWGPIGDGEGWMYSREPHSKNAEPLYAHPTAAGVAVVDDDTIGHE